MPTIKWLVFMSKLAQYKPIPNNEATISSKMKGQTSKLRKMTQTTKLWQQNSNFNYQKL